MPNESFNDQLDEILAKYVMAEESGEPISRDDLLKKHPEFTDELRRFFADRDQFKRLASPLSPEAARRNDLPAKVRYFGDYELLEEIAQGGMGVVYKARQTSLNRIVAVKMILAGHLATDADIQRFASEAQTAASLKHKAIVPIHEVGQQNGHHYFSMDLIEGCNLADVIRIDPPGPKEAARIIKAIAEAVDYAHSEGIVHRDIKPSNILIDDSGQVHITDFGIALRVEGESELTRTGQIMGTAAYMPPEQARARRDLVGPASDIYSLGAVLYDLLTGRPPFRGESSADTIRQLINTEPLSPRQLNRSTPRDLETICLKCLEKEPHKRYATAEHLADDLKRFLKGEPIVARPIGHVARTWRWCRRNPVVAVLLVLVAVSLAGGTVVSSLFAIEASNRAVAESQQRERAEEQTTLATRQREIAQREQRAAESARRAEAENRATAERQRREAERAHRRAEKREQEAKWHLYVARMFSLAPYWQRKEFGLLELALDRHKPNPDELDYRGWEWWYWRDQCEQNITHLPTEHPMHYAAFSPDGRWLALGAENASLEVWEFPPQGAAVKRYSWPGNKRKRVAWSPDSRYLAAAFGDERVDIWDVQGGDRTRSLNRSKLLIDSWGAYGADYGLGWSSDGQSIAQGGNGWVEIWNVEDGASRIINMDGHYAHSAVLCLAWHPHERKLAVGNDGGRAILYFADSGEHIWVRRICNVNLFDMSWSPDGKSLACTANYPIWGVRIVDQAGQVTHTLPGKEMVHSVSWCSDGRKLVSAGADLSIHIWDTQENQLIHSSQMYRSGRSVAAWRPNSGQIVSANPGGVKLWSATAEREPYTRISTHGTRPSDYDHGGVFMAWSPDNAYLVSGGHDTRVYIHDAHTGHRIRELHQERRSVVHAVAWHPSKPMAAAVRSNGQISIWNTETGELMRTMPAGSWGAMFRFIGWSPDGRRLLCSTSEYPDDQPKPIYWWEDSGLGERHEVTRVVRISAGWTSEGDVILPQPDKVEIWSVPFKRLLLTTSGGGLFADWWPDGEIIAAAEENGNLRFYSSHSGDPIASFRPHASEFRLQYHPSGSRLATCGNDGAVKILDTSTGDELLTLQAASTSATDLAWSPDGRRLAVGFKDGTIRIWGSPSLELPVESPDFLTTGVLATFRSPKNLFREAEEETAIEDASQRQTSQRVVGRFLLGLGARIEIDGKWIGRGEEFQELHQPISAVQLAPHERLSSFTLTQLTKLPALKRLELESDGFDLAEWPIPEKLTALTELSLRGVLVTEEGATKLSKIPNLKTLTVEPETVLPDPGKALEELRTALADVNVIVRETWVETIAPGMITEAIGSPIWGVEFTPDGRHAVTISDDERLRIFDVQSGKQVSEIHTKKRAMRGLAVTPDGNGAVISGALEHVELYDLESGERIRSYDGINDGVEKIAISPDGRFLAASAKGQCLVWDLDSAQKVLELQDDRHFRVVAFSPDSRLLAATGYRGWVSVWDLATGAEIKRFHGRHGITNGLCFTPDGHYLITAGKDGAIRVWRLEDERLVRRLTGHDGEIYSMKLLADGEHLLTGGYDGTLRLWHWPTGRKRAMKKTQNFAATVIDVSPDGETAVSGGGWRWSEEGFQTFDDYRLRSWRLP